MKNILWLIVCEHCDCPYKIHSWFTNCHSRIFSRSDWEIFLKLLQDIIDSRIMQSRNGAATKDLPVVLRVDNCSEIEVAGDGYKVNGIFFDVCCDLENVDAAWCDRTRVWKGVLMIVGIWVGAICLAEFCRWIFNKYCKTSCACCKPQPIVGNDNNATRNGTERSNISTISEDLRQPSRRVATPNAPPTSVLQERLEWIELLSGSSAMSHGPWLHFFIMKQWLRRKNERPNYRTRVD